MAKPGALGTAPNKLDERKNLHRPVRFDQNLRNESPIQSSLTAFRLI